jgi:hypothetical protein
MGHCGQGQRRRRKLPVYESAVSGGTICCQKTREFHGDLQRIVHLLTTTGKMPGTRAILTERRFAIFTAGISGGCPAAIRFA